ncbi:glutathione S-transferase family protein [Paracraurococcus ruber]|uniref:Glutathione S-transferase n=1 Tax=Paracraurococcus ruber TaxID=77675 RepID=A0ABS1CSV5_9PROT|nr:glutathione S-transferase family protein [Paracraurococcus ruber]MBK1657448.1 glutathione S-transferase [Paracraurococcus ruber]TDG32988.1 glutathione S-transferase family protein [Paracraurococcus ruber]
MPDGRLLIGNKRYSSWSMRGWLAVHLAGLDVEEVLIPFVRSEGVGATPAIQAATPAGLVPYLEHRGARVWESLAICEYCAEQAPGLWPGDPAARAVARSIAAEMATGFRGLRQAMWFIIGRDFSGLGRTPAALADIARIEAIWADCLAAHGGPFLFGPRFGLADAMYAPVVGRFLAWQPEVSATTRAYMDAVRAHPLVARWYAEALAEPASWLLASYETPPAG